MLQVRLNFDACYYIEEASSFSTFQAKVKLSEKAPRAKHNQVKAVK